MHTIQSWSINSSFSFYKVSYFYFFVLIIQTKAQTPMKAPAITKEIPLPSWQQPEKILMTT
jgi:hypothetical protein